MIKMCGFPGARGVLASRLSRMCNNPAARGVLVDLLILRRTSIGEPAARSLICGRMGRLPSGSCNPMEEPARPWWITWAPPHELGGRFGAPGRNLHNPGRTSREPASRQDRFQRTSSVTIRTPVAPPALTDATIIAPVAPPAPMGRQGYRPWTTTARALRAKCSVAPGANRSRVARSSPAAPQPF